MIIDPVIYDKIKKNKGMISTAQVVEAGVSKSILANYVKNGLLERRHHGIYTLPNEIVDDMYILMLRSKKIIFSHDTALFLNGLSERTPFLHSITISSNSIISNTIKEECTCYYVKSELHLMGMVMKKNTFGNNIRCYNAERTVCDIIKSRNRMDEETVINAIKRYALLDNKDLNTLAIYAQKLRVNKIIEHYLEVLL